MTQTILEITDLYKSFGGVAAINGVNLSVEEGEAHAIIGPNGAGKTTLIAQLSGEIMPDSGQITLQGQAITRLPMQARCHLGLARSFQITSIFREMTVLENVQLAVQAHQGNSFRFWRPTRTDASLTEPALQTIDAVGLGDRDDVVAANLSHGEQRQLEIAMALATGPRLLLLDEPMAGMGVEDSVRMVEILGGLKSKMTILLVEHDMDAVFALADRITVLVYGQPIATGTPEEIRSNDAVRAAYLGDED